MKKLNIKELKNKLKTFPSITRKFLTVNKIFFETILMLIISIAGIAVSYAGVKISSVANDISINEQNIADKEKQPVFTGRTVTNNDKTYFVVKPVFGEVKGGIAWFYRYIFITITNLENNKSSVISLYLDTKLNKTLRVYMSGYDYTNQNFKIEIFPIDFNGLEFDQLFRNILETSELLKSNRYSNILVTAEYEERLRLQYTDYKQEIKEKSFWIASSDDESGECNIYEINETPHSPPCVDSSTVYLDSFSLDSIDSKHVIKLIEDNLSSVL